jgi:hypothetical protein
MSDQNSTTVSGNAPVTVHLNAAVAPTTAPKPVQAVTRPPALTRTPRPPPKTVPGPGLAVQKGGANARQKHHTLRKIKGTVATVTAAIQAADIPALDKGWLVAKVQSMKSAAVEVNLHIFVASGAGADEKETIHATIQGLF